jgi:negative regulator of genetic competence, sporulation and motility
VNVFSSPGFESKWNFHCQKETIDAQDAMKTSKSSVTEEEFQVSDEFKMIILRWLSLQDIHDLVRQSGDSGRSSKIHRFSGRYAITRLQHFRT